MALYNRCELCKITPYDLKQFSVSLQTCDVSVALIGDVINPVVDDTALTSSSIFSAITPARLSRLNTSGENGYAGAWSARFANTAQWIKVDLGGVKTVQQVITQGRQDFNQWVLEFMIYYSLDDVTFAAGRIAVCKFSYALTQQMFVFGVLVTVHRFWFTSSNLCCVHCDPFCNANS